MNIKNSFTTSAIIGISLGVIGAIIGYYTTIELASSKIAELKSLIGKIENNDQIKSLTEKDTLSLKLLEKRIDLLEKQFLLETEVKLYNTQNIKIPETVKDRQKLVTQIKNITNNYNGKELLYTYMLHDDKNIAEVAKEKFLEYADSNDIDVLVNITITKLNGDYYICDKLRNFYNHSSRKLVIKSLLKYMYLNDRNSAFLLFTIFGPDNSGLISKQNKNEDMNLFLQYSKEKNLNECYHILEAKIIKME